MKIGIVGNGMIVTQMLTDVQQTEAIRPVSLCVRPKSVDTGKRLAAQYGMELFTDYQDFLKNGEFDTVYIGVINSEHFRYTEAALKAGKHVICEKPFTVKAEEANILKESALKNHLFLWEACKIPYSPVFREIQGEIGNVGHISLIQCNFSKISSRFRRYEKGEVLPAFDPKAAGGCLMDLNVYNIRFVTELLGRPKEIRYFANRGFNGIDTSGTAVLSYEGCQAVCSAAKDSTSPSFAFLQGTEGCIRVEGPVSNLLKAEITDGQGTRLLAEDREGGTLAGEFREFERQLREGDYESCRKALENSIAVMEVLEACRRYAGIQFSGDQEISLAGRKRF